MLTDEIEPPAYKRFEICMLRQHVHGAVVPVSIIRPIWTLNRHDNMGKGKPPLVNRLETIFGTVLLVCEQPADGTFLYTLFRTHALPALPLDGPGRETLVRLQNEARTSAYRTQFPDAYFAIVHLAGAPAGRLVIDKVDDFACIVDFALIPEVRNRGLGTAIIGGVLDWMARTGTIVRCKVLCNNIASLRMFRRLGFVHVGGEPPFLQLEWHPPSPDKHHEQMPG
jgi:RimJ/RimL family protein N-acetyltransferase